MGVYCYRAIPKGKGQRRGIVEAQSLAEAKERLRQQGVFVTALWSKERRHRGQSLKGQVRVTFTSQLAQLIHSGLPVFESLVALEEQNREESYHTVLLSLCDQIRRGVPLSQAMQQHPESFDSLYCAMVAAGEASGNLASTLRSLSALLTGQLRIRKQIVSALTYPCVVAVFCLAVVYLLLTFAIPSIAALLADRKVGAFTATVLAISRFFTTSWPIYLPILCGTGTAALLYLRSRRGAAFRKNLLLRLPLLRGFVIRVALGRFSRTLATLHEGGVPLIDGLRLSRAVMLHPNLETDIQRAEQKIIEGSSLSCELKRLEWVPALMARMVAVGEESGSLAPMLGQIAEIYEEEVERGLTKLTSFIQPAVLLIMGVIVGMIMLAVLLPLTDVSSIF